MLLEPTQHLHELPMAENHDLSTVAPCCICQQAPGPINKLPEGFCARTVAVVRVTEIPIRQYPRTPGGSRRTHTLPRRKVGELLYGSRAYRHAKPPGEWLRRLPGTHKRGAQDRRWPAGPVSCKVLRLPNPQVCQGNAIRAIGGRRPPTWNCLSAGSLKISTPTSLQPWLASVPGLFTSTTPTRKLCSAPWL